MELWYYLFNLLIQLLEVFGVAYEYKGKRIKKILNNDKKNKYGEFYTQIKDIENDLKHYKKYFKNKVFLCNCDDSEWSNFWKYFETNFESFGFKSNK